MSYDLTYISFGGGVQSTALLAMSCLGLSGVPKADVAVFADTGAEPDGVYAHVAAMTIWSAAHGVEVVTVRRGNLERVLVGEESSRGDGFIVSIPAFTGGNSNGMLWRQCTSEFKINPILSEVRRRLGLKARQRAAGKFTVLGMIGISVDEFLRAKPSMESWIEHRWPLIDLHMNRNDCVKLCADLALPSQPQRSACVFCPFHSDGEWQRMKDQDPDSFARAVTVDDAIRDLTRAGVKNPVYLHRKRIPLVDIDFHPSADLFGQWDNECEGVCGV